MSERIFIKVVGFTDVERHALNTVFRLSEQRDIAYALWMPDAPAAPQLALIDGHSEAARTALGKTADAAEPKLIWVGEAAPAHAGRVFERPLQWPAVVLAMDELFGATSDLDLDFDALETDAAASAAKRVLVVDALFEDRLYLRTKLASLGLLNVDEAISGAQAIEMLKQQTYGAALICVDLADMNAWELITKLTAKLPPVPMVIATTASPSLLKGFKAWWAGCKACLGKPLLPPRLNSLLKQI